MRQNRGKDYAAPHNGIRDNLATLWLYTKLAVRLSDTYGRGKTIQGKSRKCVRSIAG
jgi:hypothetical protein